MTKTNNDCSICLENINKDDYKLNCNHIFHKNCISQWLIKSSNCPLCRSHVDADIRYVNDGIITEERRLHIENLKAICIWTATGLEWLFPNSLEGYLEKTQEMLESNEGKDLLEQASLGRINQIPKNLLLELGINGLSQFIENGGMKMFQ